MNKSEFIQSFGTDVSADEIVAKGKEQGLTLTKKYVYTKQSEKRKRGPDAPAKEAKAAVTTSAKKRRKVGKAPRQASIAGAPAKPAMRPAGGDAARRMKALIVEMGTVRADELYRTVRAQLDAIVGG